MQLHNILIQITQFHHASELEQLMEHISQDKSGLKIQELNTDILQCNNWKADLSMLHLENVQDVFLITDSRPAADWALQHGIGFAVYLNEESRQSVFPEALYCIEDLSVLTVSQIERMYLRFHKLPWTIFETERCIVREITTDDVDALYQIYADKEISKYTEDLFAERAEELAYTKDYIENQYRFYEYGMWVILRKFDNRLIGRAGLSNREGFEEAELGYVIAADCQRQGYASEVCTAVLHYAKEELGMQSVQAFTVQENQASLALLKKLGFSYREQAELSGMVYARYEVGL